MKVNLKRICALLAVLVSTVAGARNVDIGQVRAWIDEGMTTVEEDCLLEVVLVSVPDNPNLGMNDQISSDTVNNLKTKRIGYFQSADGSLGLLIHFQKTATIRAIPRFATVTVNLKGARLERNKEGGYCVYDAPVNSVVSVREAGRESIPVKMRAISELTDADVYTLVRVQDVEFVFKDGSYSNVYEAHAQRSKVNSACVPTQKIDNWAGLLCDSEANPLYYVLSTRASWRRTGEGVPQGKGWLEGIVIPNTDMPRYGGKVLGKYQILPMSAEAFCFKDESSWNVMAEWNWNDNVPEIHTTTGDRKAVQYEKIIADEGEGELSINTGGRTVRFRDMNNVAVISEKDNPEWKGIVSNGALSVQCPSSSWWNWSENRGKGLQLIVPTRNIKASRLALGFTFAAGKCNAEGALHFPCKWTVEYSSDGRNYVKANDKPIILRALPYSNYTINGERYETSSEAGAGYTEHLLQLPAGLLGKNHIYIRIVPESTHAATLAYEGTMNGSLHPSRKNTTIVNFGAIKVMYR